MTLHDSVVLYDKEYTHRWVDAFGPNVRKLLWVEQYPLDSGTATAVNASTITGQASHLGGGWVFTTAGADNDGIQYQLNTEIGYFGGPYPCYFGAKFAISSATQSDFVLGYAITDTSVCAGCTDYIGFTTVDGDAALNFVINKDSAATTVDLGDLVATTYYTVEFYYDGTTVYYYLDGALIGSFTAADATNMPDDEHLAPTLAFLTGDNAAITLTFKWARWIQIYE
jgi:hypothetical protein